MLVYWADLYIDSVVRRGDQMENSPVARDKDELRAKILRMRSRDK